MYLESGSGFDNARDLFKSDLHTPCCTSKPWVWHLSTEGKATNLGHLEWVTQEFLPVGLVTGGNLRDIA